MENQQMPQRRPGEKWDSFVERLILEAQEAGEFDNLPGFGKPLPDLDEPYDENWWIKDKLRRERLSLLPPGLQARVDVERAVEGIWSLANEAAVRLEVAAINEKIRRSNYSPAWGPSADLLPLDMDEVLRQWRERR